MTDVTKKNFKEEVELCDRLAVIDLYADWCGPCMDCLASPTRH